MVQDRISGKLEWSVDADGMQLGFFSFAKLLMYHDLDMNNWPDNILADHALNKGLLLDGFPEDIPHFSPQDKLDEKLDPTELIQVINADASQTKVIEETRHGSNLVVQGPPGTGKSQTITNIIAAAVHDGKSVLFVAEKMAALSVVHSRLRDSGLDPICLELHSHKANKKAFAKALADTLQSNAKTCSNTNDASHLRTIRNDLNHITGLLHDPLPDTGDTPYKALSENIGCIGQNVPPPKISIKGLAKLDHKARTAAFKAIKTYTDILAYIENPDAHPFRGTTALALQPNDLLRLHDELKTAQQNITNLLEHAVNIANSVCQARPYTFQDIYSLAEELEFLAKAPNDVVKFVPILFNQKKYKALKKGLESCSDWAKAYKDATNRFTQSAFETDLDALRSAIVSGQDSLLARWLRPYRHASRKFSTLLSDPLPGAAAERLVLLDELARLQLLYQAYTAEEELLQTKLTTLWHGKRTAFAKILTAIEWFEALQKRSSFVSEAQLIKALEDIKKLARLAKGLRAKIDDCTKSVQAPLERLGMVFNQAGFGTLIEDSSLAALNSKFQEMATDTNNQYTNWVDYIHARTQIEANSTASILEAISTGQLEPERAEQEFRFACAEARWSVARAERPELDKLAHRNRHNLVRDFRYHEQERINATKALILFQHFKQIPKGTDGEMGIIWNEIGRKRGHKSIRWIMERAGQMVQRIKPVMLMSPISVAQFLPPGSVNFDLLVIDEASQVRPEDALGVIARTKQIVVVGDKQQLPPTSFFNRLIDDGDEDNEDDEPIGATVADMESILSACETRGLRQRMLEWHYRSRDPSLIRVSNAEFYNDRLILPPSPLQLDDDYGLKFTNVGGVYARDGSGSGRHKTNRDEAEAIAKAVTKHAHDCPNLSLGVVSFSKPQADMLSEILEYYRRSNQKLDTFLREGKKEDFLSKTLKMFKVTNVM